MKINFDIPYENKGAWKVPEGYFDALPDRVMSRIEQASKISDTGESTENKKRARIFSLPRRVVGYAAAACVAAGVVLTVALNGTFTKSASPQNMAATQKTAVTTESETYSEEFRQDCYEYAMVDADDVYDYIIED